MTSPPDLGDGRTVFLIDGWHIFRRSLRLFVAAAGYTVVGEAETVEAATAVPGLAMADIVILDPGVSWTDIGVDVATIRGAAPSAALVMLTAEPLDADASSQAFLAGVEAQLTKDAGPAELLGALALAWAGNFVVLPLRQPAHGQRPSLTRREQEILTLIAQGFSDRTLRDMLWVSQQTIDFHVANILQRLGARNREAAVGRARAYGLIPRWGGWDTPPEAGSPAA
jgi:DNA-binding NarL/FixJ family response regulator